MLVRVIHGRALKRQIEKGKIPLPVLIKLQGWAHLVETRGMEETRKTPGYHDEPCVALLKGYRSIRLSRGWRAYCAFRSKPDSHFGVMADRVSEAWRTAISDPCRTVSGLNMARRT